MPLLTKLLDLVLPMAPAVAVVLIFATAGRLAKRLLEAKPGTGGRGKVRLQGTLLVLSLAGLLAVVVVLPVEIALRGQLLSLLGIVLSAAIALASTTFVGNIMAGMMIGAVRNFHSGDYIQVKDYTGRVTEHGLLSTEIQTEQRDLITLPNLYLVVNPVRVVRKSGTIVSTTVSLGYDVPRDRIEKLLLQAAETTGLQEPFVRVDELGDFSVTYRIAGLLTKTRRLLTTRSRLRGATLDALHSAGVEIVSPNFMNTRMIAEAAQFIPQVKRQPTGKQSDHEPVAEDTVFDKATEAENLEMLKQEHDKACEEIKAEKERLKGDLDDQEKKRVKLHIEFLEQRCVRLAERADQMASKIEQGDKSEN